MTEQPTPTPSLETLFRKRFNGYMEHDSDGKQIGFHLDDTYDLEHFFPALQEVVAAALADSATGPLPPTSLEKWIEQLQRVMDAAPKGIWLYAASGTLYVMSYDIDGTRMVTDGGSMDQDAIVKSVRTPEIDGGDW